MQKKLFKRLFKRKTEGAHIYIYGLAMTFLIFLVTLCALRIQQVNQLYDEIDEGLASALLSSAIINRDEQTKTKQIVISDLENFDGHLDFNEMCNTRSDAYMQNCLEKFLYILKENLKLDDDFVSTNPLIQTDIQIVNFSIYNKYEELTEKNEIAQPGFGGGPTGSEAEEDGQYLTGNYRFCKHTYNAKTGSWEDPVLYNTNQAISVADSLTGKNIELQGTTVVAQVAFQIKALPFLEGLFPNGYNESDLVKTIYYQRMADIVTTGHQYDIICEHDFVEVSRKEPDCRYEGYVKYKCSKCGETATQTLAPLGHDMVDGSCTRCGYSESTEASLAAPVLSGKAVSGGAELSWNNVNGAKYYELWKSTDGGETWTKVVETPETTYTDIFEK